MTQQTGSVQIQPQAATGGTPPVYEMARPDLTKSAGGTVVATINGANHPLSEVYGSLALAQADFPFVTSLTQSRDWAALQKALYVANANVFVTAGTWWCSDMLTLPSRNCRVVGAGQNTTTIQVNASGYIPNLTDVNLAGGIVWAFADGMRMIAPVNNGWEGDSHLSDFAIQLLNTGQNIGGCIDIAGTGQVHIDHVTTIGGRFGVIWDGNEIVSIDKCSLISLAGTASGPGSNTGACLWAVNGSDHLLTTFNTNVSATGGNFTLNYGAATSAAINWNDTPAQMLTKITAMASVGANNASVFTGASSGVLPGTVAGGLLSLSIGTPTPTTLNAAITIGATSLTVVSATGFPGSGNYMIRVGSENMLVTAGQGTTTWTVTRAQNGTSATAHTLGEYISLELTVGTNSLTGGSSDGTLTAGLTSGNPVTTLATTSLTVAVVIGDGVTVTSGGNTQTFTANAGSVVGASSISVVSQNANFSYPIGSTVTVTKVNLQAVIGGITNEYGITNCQFSPGVAAPNIAVDGGLGVIIANCNFNGGLQSIRAADTQLMIIKACESESQTIASGGSFLATSTSSVTGAGGRGANKQTTLIGNQIAATNAGQFGVDAIACQNLVSINNFYQPGADVAINNIDSVPTFASVMDFQSGSGGFTNQNRFATQDVRMGGSVAAGGQFTGLSIVGYPQLQSVKTITPGAGAYNIDASAATIQRIALTTNVGAATIINPHPNTQGVVANLLTIMFVQDGTGGRTHSFPTNCRFLNGTAPNNTGANTMDVVNFMWDATTSLWFELSRATAVPVI